MHPLFAAPTHSGEPKYLIGKVAEITGASRKAIRHYEEIGLLPPPARRGKYRIYSEKQVFMVHVIKHAQQFGFALAETRELITAIAASSNFPLKQARAFLERKQQWIALEKKRLSALARDLRTLEKNMEQMFGA